jgi:hypothetical protein
MMAAFQSPEQRQAYVDYLTSEGHFTPEEAQAQADKITSGSQQNKKSTSGGIMPPEPAEVQKLLNKSVEERAKQEGLTFTEKVGLGAGGAALLAGGGYLLGGGKPTSPSGGQGLKGRVFGPDVSATRIEPQMDVSRPTEPYFEGEKAPKPTTAGTWEDLLSPEEKALIERSRANAPVREEYMKQIAPPVPTEPPAFIRNQPPASTAPVPELPAATNPRVPALLQPPAGAAVPSVALAPVPPTADKPAPPPPAPAPITPAATVPVAEISATAAPITQPTVEAAVPEKSAPPPKTKAPKPEYFEGYKKLPGTERQLLGTLGVANNTERAKSLVDALKSTLPEGAALEFPKTEAGVSKGGMPNPQDVMAFTNKHLGTAMKLDEAGKFPADFRYTEENLAKMHQSILDEYANAKTPSAKAAAEKGFATLRSLAGLAGFGALAYGSLEAYKHGKKTGDWTPAGELGLNTIAGAINPALMLGTHMTGLNAGEEQELAKRRYNAMVGGGRGTTPASAYKR